MSSRAREFVADELWLVIAVLTLGVAGLAGTLGLAVGADVVSTVGWFILTPIFFFWGEEIAAFVFDEHESEESSSESDAVERLKKRYARGEIDDAEFEHRLERLVETDQRPAETIERGATDSGPETEIETDR